MKNDLANITPVKAGEKALGVLTATRINALQNLARDSFFGNNVSSVGPIVKSSNGNGYSLAIDMASLMQIIVNNVTSENGLSVKDEHNNPFQLRLIELELCDGRKVRVLGGIVA